MLLAELDQPGCEPAEQRRAHRDRRCEHGRIEQCFDQQVGGLFHTFIVNELAGRFDEVRGCFVGGVVPTIALRIGGPSGES
jgi:hypothetical protein